MHPLLRRQLLKFIGPSATDPEPLPPPWRGFVKAVGEAYEAADANQAMIERAMDIASEELGQRNELLLEKNAELERVEQSVRQINEDLERRVDERTEALRTAMEVADKANQAKSMFLATMSHEMRTPLNGVIGLTELLIDSGLNAEQLDHARLIKTSGDSLSRLIDDILDLSKIEAKKLEIESVDFDLLALCEDVTAVMALKASDKGLALIRTADPEVPRVVRGDPGRTKQVLVNLLNNAIKFTPNGSVTLRVTLEHAAADKSTVRFSITDTGIGIPADRMDRLFQSFSQIDSSMSRVYGGTGLGLAICKQLTLLMGGTIDVVSVVKEGSTFFFTIPFEAATATSNDGPPSETVPTHTPSSPADSSARAIPARILLVEDNRVNQIVSSKLLRARGWQVDIAETGADGVAMSMNARYDLILMDCSMPDMDGFEATRIIRQLEEDGPNGRTPIVALTANAIEGDRDRCIAAGMDDYLTKPVDRVRLERILDYWLARSRPSAAVAPPTAVETGPDKIPADAASPVDIESLMDRFMQDAQIVLSVVTEFERQASENLSDLTSLFERGDNAELARVAHALKGASSAMSADKLMKVAAEIEKAGRSGVAHQATEELLQRLNEEVHSCLGYLPTVRDAVTKLHQVDPMQSGVAPCPS